MWNFIDSVKSSEMNVEVQYRMDVSVLGVYVLFYGNLTDVPDQLA